ncbi:PP2C family protein-serine/threonine phosphatase [Roseofilum capinflatum]|uniref:PP2C family protein-serine/threonine phosphatase n=1 Tax=Roseofilum capinflatum BLCC-M114 TaxID=3022440 RepID=A0ABT7BE72_9CYAN|nr:PP2C family protein-serine/threonine phosphatase [Roseofilum capinflatum]MDJ1176884.1 PP2C family protein-serine/threonine phosphatase [Roseofilum capinflatum BLCC-M114]
MSAVPIPQPSPQPPGNSTPQLPSNSPQAVSEDQSPVHALKELVARLRREQHKIQDLLMSLGFALRSFNNLNQFLELIPLMAGRVTDADGGALVLFQANGKLKLEQMHCHDSHQCQDIRQALETVNRQLNLTNAGTPSLEEMTVLLDREVNHYLGCHTQLFGTAVIVRKTERARLYVFSRNPEYTWTETREKLLRLIADQTAVAIENDELSVELRKKERLDRELEIGAEIQNQLLPNTYPQIEGLKLAARCQTANRVGGDYYDFISIHPPEWLKHSGVEAQGQASSGRWCITVGDVMGKGVPAGLIMTMLRGMLRAEVLNGHSPSRILKHLNHAMYQDLEQANRFVTLFYSEYDPSTQRLSYSNAAHNPPFLWQASNQSIQRLDTMGMLIGLDLDSEYEDGHSQLYPGDIIIYYTDGFTDASNRQGDRFDEDNLIEAFQFACQHYPNPQRILDYLFDRVNDFMGPGNDHRDDMTLVVMQVDPNVN